MPTKTQLQFPDSRQAQARDVAVWFDQHRDSHFTLPDGTRLFEYGRPWWSSIEKRSGMPTGPIYPMGWVAPWMPSPSYITDSIGRIAKHDFGSSGIAPKSIQSDRFSINYGRMAADFREATMAHYQYAVSRAANEKLPVPELGRPFDHRLVALVGVPPLSPKIPEAAMGGNKWLLGQLMPTRDPVTGILRVEEDEELARILRLSSPDFLTYEQAERKAVAESKVEGDLKEVLAEVLEAKRELVKLKAELEAERAAKPKRGRPKKDSTTAGV